MVRIRKKIRYSLLCACLTNALFAKTFYIDPVNGSNLGDGSKIKPWHTLQEVVEQKLISSYQYSTPYDPGNPLLSSRNVDGPIGAGDTIMLMSGLHGTLFLQNYINPWFITIIGAEGHNPIIRQVHFQACKFWRIENITVSSEPYGEYINSNLIYLESHNWQGPTSRIEVKHCDIYSTAEPWTTANQWISQVSRGIQIKGDSIVILKNKISNISFGIQMQGDYIQSIGNEIKNFSGDGLRILGSHCLVESNTIKNCYAVDQNHDDGIQSFTTNGNIVDYDTVRGNTILNYEDPNQPLLGPLQGIGCFDGFYNNWIVENNLIVVNHWHGITFLGANNCNVINNTVLDPTPDITPGASWIRIDNHKDGRPSTGCIVKNNAANNFVVDGDTIGNLALHNYQDYMDNFINYENYNFHLTEDSRLIDAGDRSLAPPFDHDGIIRPQGDHIDIGAFEFEQRVTANENSPDGNVRIFPNPALDRFYYEFPHSGWNLIIADIYGRRLRIYRNLFISGQININDLATGLYIITLVNPKRNFSMTKKLIHL